MQAQDQQQAIHSDLILFVCLKNKSLKCSYFRLSCWKGILLNLFCVSTFLFFPFWMLAVSGNFVSDSSVSSHNKVYGA